MPGAEGATQFKATSKYLEDAVFNPSSSRTAPLIVCSAPFDLLPLSFCLRMKLSSASEPLLHNIQSLLQSLHPGSWWKHYFKQVLPTSRMFISYTLHSNLKEERRSPAPDHSPSPLFFKVRGSQRKWWQYHFKQVLPFPLNTLLFCRSNMFSSVSV